MSPSSVVDVRRRAAEPRPRCSTSIRRDTTIRPAAPGRSRVGSDADGEVVTFTWDFDGDGAFDDGTRHPNYTYVAPGTYEVRVKGSDGKGGEQDRAADGLRRMATRAAAGRSTASLPSVVRVGRPTIVLRLAIRSRGGSTARHGHADVRPRRRRAVRRHADAELRRSYIWTFPTTDPGDRGRARAPTAPAARRSAPRGWSGSENLAPMPIYVDAPASRRADRSPCAPTPSTPTATPTFAWDLDGDARVRRRHDFPGRADVPGPGSYTIGLRVTDDEGAFATVTRTFTSARGRRWRPSPSPTIPAVNQVLTLTAARPTRTATRSHPRPGTSTTTARSTMTRADGATSVFATVGARRVGLKVRDASGETGIRFVRLDVTANGEATPTPTATATATRDRDARRRRRQRPRRQRRRRRHSDRRRRRRRRPRRPHRRQRRRRPTPTPTATATA